MKAADWAAQAARHHSNLNAFASLVALIEGGVFYGSETHAATAKITAICHRETAKFLRLYDDAIARVRITEVTK